MAIFTMSKAAVLFIALACASGVLSKRALAGAGEQLGGPFGGELPAEPLEPECDVWTARLDYTGSEITEDDHGNGIMGTVDLRPASYNGERRKECARLCNLHSDCGVATYYAASKACTMRTQEATEVSALVPCWTLVKCPTEVVEEKDCDKWTKRMEYTGTLLSDINLTDKVFDGRFWKGCADKCRAHNQCGVATYYADTKKCILLKAGEATVLSADKRKVHSFVRCEAEEVGNGEEEEEEEECLGLEDEGGSQVKGLYSGLGGCVRYDLPKKGTLAKCEKACEDAGFQFCSWKENHPTNRKPCAGFFEREEHGSVLGDCQIAPAHVDKPWQQDWASFQICAACGRAYAQCGGKTFTGARCCAPGFKCIKHGPYYSACEPRTPKRCGAMWDQCGGDGWQGPRCCVKGAVCVAQSPHYSQCMDIRTLTRRDIVSPSRKVDEDEEL